jgi:hypothetical protein
LYWSGDQGQTKSNIKPDQVLAAIPNPNLSATDLHRMTRIGIKKSVNIRETPALRRTLA